ncbi:MAG: peptidylprolyl isomerase, partial [Asticcacaulis sp.]
MGSIVIDGVAIPETMLREEMAHHRAASPAEARQQAGQALAIRALLLHRAETLGLSAEPETDPDGRLETEDEALLRVLLEQELQVTEPEDVEIERFYQANTDRFRAPLLYAASHILFPVAEGQSSDAALAEAISALAYLQNAPGEFANLARANSGCPSAGVGGSLGQLSKGDLFAPVEQALLSVEPGAFYPDPVLSPFGVHVLRLDQLWPGEI